ncbi:MAG: ATP-binding cassette domain-containing protein [Christensenellales bacterium]
MAAIPTANHLEKEIRRACRAALTCGASIEPGKLVGLLGPNGAGKSTLIKCSMGLLTPTSGEIAIGGVKPGPASKSITSYLPDRMALSSRPARARRGSDVRGFLHGFRPYKGARRAAWI